MNKANPVLGAYLGFAALCLAIPVICMMWMSLDANQLPTLPIKSYSLHWYQEAWDNPDIREGLTNSLIVGSIVSLLSTVLGVVSSYWLCRRFPPGMVPLYVSLVSMPCFAPLLLAGMAMLMYYQTIHLAGNIPAIVAAHTCYCSPFALSLIRLGYDRLNPDIELAAANLGASRLRILTTIVVPQLWPAIIAASMLSFLVSWDEFIMSWFVGGFSKTLPMVLFDMIGSSYTPAINAVGTIVTLASGLILALIVCLFQVSGKMQEAPS